VLVLLLAASIQAGCGGDDDGGDGDAPALEGTEWTLVDGVDAPSDSVPTLTLEEGIASGFGGCNSFTGGYELDDDSITIGPLAATLMACEDDKSAAEAAYVPALEAADSWAIEDGELILSTDGEETLRFEAADVEDSSAAQVQQLEEEIDALREENAALEEQSADFEQQVADLRQSLDDLQSEAEGGAAGAQEALDAARAQYEALADELGAKGQSLAQSRTELRRLRAESEAALAAAQDAASTAAERAEAQQARAELAEACLAGRRRRPAALLCQRRPGGCHRADDRGARAGRRRLRAAGLSTDRRGGGGSTRG
jgi:heat shock protein HslJ